MNTIEKIYQDIQSLPEPLINDVSQFVEFLKFKQQIKQDLKKIKYSGRYKLDDLLTVIELLSSDKIPDEKYKCHPLTGSWKNYTECHIKPNWLLIYKLTNEKLILTKTVLNLYIHNSIDRLLTLRKICIYGKSHHVQTSPPRLRLRSLHG